MNYASILKCDTNNGDGFRVTLFVSGCTLNCPLCHNKAQQNFKYGKQYTKETENSIIEYVSKDYIRGFSLLGGEPFDNICDDLINLLKRIKREYPSKTIYVWSGYTYEEIINKPRAIEMLKSVDMLRDGRYIAELRNLKQYLQGSSNQRIIDIQKTLKSGVITKWEVSYE